MDSYLYKVGIYMRLSREDGDDKESESIENQRKLINNFIEEKNKLEKFILINEYYDDGYTGTNFNRPGFRKMIKDIENGIINTIITKDLSRLGRDHIDVGNYIEREFPARGVRYIAIGDNIDSITFNNQFLIFKLGFNDYYSQDISLKIKKVKEMKALNGEYQASQAPYGYKKSKLEKNKLEIDEEAAEIVKNIFSMYLEGYGTRKIAEILNEKGIKTPGEMSDSRKYKSNNPIWYRTTISKILKNEVYIGSVVSLVERKINYKIRKSVRMPKDKWVIVPNMHKPIIDKKIFYKVQDLMKEKSKERIRKYDHPLKGLIKCGLCGANFTIKVDNRKKNNLKTNFLCSSKNNDKNNCRNPSISGEIINKEIQDNLIYELKKICFNKKDIENIIKDIEIKFKEIYVLKRNEISKIEKKIEKIDIDLQTIYQDRLEGRISLEFFDKIYMEKNEEKNQYINDLENIKSLEEQEEKIFVINENNIKKIIKDIYNQNNITKEFLKSLIKTVDIYPNYKMMINYKFK